MSQLSKRDTMEARFDREVWMMYSCVFSDSLTLQVSTTIHGIDHARISISWNRNNMNANHYFWDWEITLKKLFYFLKWNSDREQMSVLDNNKCWISGPAIKHWYTNINQLFAPCDSRPISVAHKKIRGNRKAKPVNLWW